jgi:alkylation response protein AidB-like acyl-CoA dehydrogenase
MAAVLVPAALKAGSPMPAAARAAAAADLPPPLDGEALLAAVRRLADGPLAAIAEAVDRQGRYPEGVLRELGRLGALQCHHADRDIPGASADYGLAIRAMAEVSRVCGATGFLTWCHMVCGLYMEQSRNPALGGDVLRWHGRALTMGATGMSNPMKSFAGIEQFLLRAVPDGDGYRVSGTLPWVSNLGDDHYFGVVAPVVAADGTPQTRDGAPHEIMFLVHCDAAGVERRDCPSFSAMEGTNTWAVRLTDYRVGPQQLLADPARHFIARIRGAFVLLQAGMAVGITQGAIDSMWAVEPQLGHVNRFLDDRPDALQAELDALTARVLALARDPFETDPEFFIEVLDARAHGAELALRAAQSALLHAGARGYLMSSPVQRRVRESHFVAIVTPALKHLRKEIARLSTPAMPA